MGIGDNAREILTFLFKSPHTYCDLRIVLSTIDQRNQTTQQNGDNTFIRESMEHPAARALN